MTQLDWRELFVGTQVLSYAANTIVLAEGETNEFLFLVVDGTVAIERAGHRIASLTRGSYFGELTAFLDEPLVSATAIAVETPAGAASDDAASLESPTAAASSLSS